VLSILEEIRFGLGPVGPEPAARPAGFDPDRVLATLDATDATDPAFRRPGLAERLALIERGRAEQREYRRNPDLGRPARDESRRMIAEDQALWIPRLIAARQGFRERLAAFWGNRFTVAARGPVLSLLVQPFHDQAIRPHLAGRFADLLRAVALSPAMLLYLDQSRSVGPNSEAGRRRGLGLNENFARELLELHSMGVGYTQADVTEAARLLTGLVVGPGGTAFDPRQSEPGRFTILGRTYGREGREGLAEIERFLDDLAHRPETADSVAFGLCRHFLADEPPAGAVAAVARAFRASGGDLRATYRALVTRPEAAAPDLGKVRTPTEYVVAGCRALGLSGMERDSKGAPRGTLRFGQVLPRMGQPLFRPDSPRGWPDVGSAWVSAPLLAARIDWAADLARAFAGRLEPAMLAEAVLGPLAGDGLRFAVGAAEQRWEGVAVLLASPAFMRR
jgi:uncharacterized protein (DUF1800 family)